MSYELKPLVEFGDERGNLVVLEQMSNVHFEIKRVYFIYGTAEGVRRGLHAHRTLNQAAIALQGSCKFLMDDGQNKQEITLDKNTEALLIEPMIWHEMYDFSDDCILLVIADQLYDESDYIRDYMKFKRIVEA